MNEGKTAVLFYDGACPVCSAEIARLRRGSNGSLRALDIHGQAFDQGEETDALLRTLHYVSPDGSLLVGLDANVAAWQHTRWGFAFRWLRWPLVRPVASWIYNVWARARYQRLYGDKREAAPRP